MASATGDTAGASGTNDEMKRRLVRRPTGRQRLMRERETIAPPPVFSGGAREGLRKKGNQAGWGWQQPVMQ